jgi:diketogulonate reductase-like aldo/keto reductase
MRPALTLSLVFAVNGAAALDGVPKIMLGTGGGGGGFNAPAWLAQGGSGFNTALAYCYQQFTPQCSHVAIANAVAALGPNASAFISTKLEPEDFGPTALISGAFRVVDRDVLAELNIKPGSGGVGMLMWHQAGRAAAASNYRPPCFNASAAGPAGPGAYAACRLQGYQALLDVQRAGGARYIGVSNYEVRDLQQIFDGLGVWPQVLEIEVHPYYHPDALIDFA